MKEHYSSYDYFIGQSAPFLLFEMEYHSLSYVVENHKEDRWYPDINPAAQVANIGILAYFEAFCKHQFAAIMNLFTSLISNFALKRGEPKIEISTIMAYGSEFENNIGFFLAETYDFGTAKSINALFHDLLIITPFSADEEKQMNEIVYQRNLLVHHAGQFTLQYAKSKSNDHPIREQAYKNAVRIDTADFYANAEFLFAMAIKIAQCTVKVVRSLPEYTSLNEDDDRTKAVEAMLQGINDTLDN